VYKSPAKGCKVKRNENGKRTKNKHSKQNFKTRTFKKN
jgi:hypothetical protein